MRNLIGLGARLARDLCQLRDRRRLARDLRVLSTQQIVASVASSLVELLLTLQSFDALLFDVGEGFFVFGVNGVGVCGFFVCLLHNT